MKKYVKPIVLANEELAEGVYACSGSNGHHGHGCYTTDWHIHQVEECGRKDYRIQVNAHHRANHTRCEQTAYFMFSCAVEFVSSRSGCYVSGSGTNTIVVKYRYHQNPTDEIGLGDLIVKCDVAPTVMDVKVVD